MDPARVADIRDIVSARRLSAGEAEKFVIAITGGGDNVDLPLWDMIQALFALGALTRGPRLSPRDAAIGCLLDETGVFLRPLRREGAASTLAGAQASASSEGIALDLASGARREFAWGRVIRALALADFLFAAESPAAGIDSGSVALGRALDMAFGGEDFDESLLRRAIAEPARFMRAWRKAYLPLFAFAELIRCRESFLAAAGRRAERRELDADDVVGLWRHALQRGETWSFARYLEKLAALLREERAASARRGFIAPASMDDLAGREPGGDPEAAIVELIDLARGGPALVAGDDDEAGDDELPGIDDDALDEPTVAALLRLPGEPKLLTKEERESAARMFALLPIAHEQPLSMIRAVVVAPWENRLVEASRRRAGDIDVAPPAFDYDAAGEDAAYLQRRFDELLLIGVALSPDGESACADMAADGAKLLKRWRHARASFRVEDAKLAQTFARVDRDLRTVFGALQRIVRQNRRFVASADMGVQAEADKRLFGDLFAWRYREQLERQ